MGDTEAGNAIRETSQVEDALKRLMTEIQVNQEEVNNLKRRLAPVLGEHPPATDKAGKRETTGGAQAEKPTILDVLMMAATDVESSNQVIRETTERLQI